MTDQKAFENLKTDNRADALGWIYRTHRDRFVRWAIVKYRCTPDDGKDMFMTALIRLTDNVRDEKTKTLTSALLTFLIGIGENIKHETVRLAARDTEIMYETARNMENELPPDLDETRNEKDTSLEQLKKLSAAIEKLGEPCKSLIEYFYFDKKRDEDTMQLLGYSSAAVVRGSRARCLKKLSDLLSNKTPIIN